jgi:hypothetical protein
MFMLLYSSHDDGLQWCEEMQQEKAMPLLTGKWQRRLIMLA